MNTFPKIRLKKSELKRFQSLHPWVYSNELVESSKGIEAGSIVELCLENGDFLALGFANSKSLIAFRVLTRKKEDIDASFFIRKISEARKLRDTLGLQGSRRIVHGESDYLPGLIIDEFFISSNETQRESILSVHLNSAGIDKAWNDFALSEKISQIFTDTDICRAIIIHRDSKGRELEGLADLPQEFIHVQAAELDFANLKIDVDVGEVLPFCVDLISGQKGGFFLDQRANVATLRNTLQKMKFNSPVRVLDLFSYCGQWGVGVGALLKDKHSVEVTFADASDKALALATRTSKDLGLAAQSVQLDLVEKDWPWEPRSFDVVICDPPALIKSKKHYFAGKRAYEKVMARASRLLKYNGVFVASSCSYHLSREDLREVLNPQLRIFGELSLPPDHTALTSFPEGHYLKGYYLI